MGDSAGGEANNWRESEGGTTNSNSLPDDDAAALTLRTLEREVGLPSGLLPLAFTRMPPLMVLLMHQDVNPFPVLHHSLVCCLLLLKECCSCHDDLMRLQMAVMSAIRHPNVVLFMGVCLEPPCMVTEFCARGSLYDVLGKARASQQLAVQLDWPKRLNMALDAAKVGAVPSG